MSKVNKELLACLNKAGHLTSQLEEVLGEAEMLCREDNSIPQELWQEIEEHEANCQSINSEVNETVERLAIKAGF